MVEAVNVDEAAKLLIDAAIEPIRAELATLREAVHQRREERETERQDTADKIARIDDYVHSVVKQRNQEIADRPTAADVDTRITAAITTATATFSAAITGAIGPLTSEMTGLREAVGVRLSDRADGLQRHDRELDMLNGRVRDLERQALQHMEYIADLRRTLHGDVNAKDNHPSVFGELIKIGELITRNDASLRRHIQEESLLAETRMSAIERRLTPVEEYINRQVAAENARAERRRKLKEAATAVVKNSPLWVKVLAGLGMGSGVALALAELLRSTVGL